MPSLASQLAIVDNDPTVLGWGICFAYLITSWYCFKKANQLKDNQASKLFWCGLACLMLFLGLNKQLDLQTILASFARQASITDGWYAYRKQIQHAFIILLALSLGFLLIFFRVLLAEAWHRFKLAWLGILVLFGFIVLRAAAFNHQAKALLEPINDYYQLLELLGIVLIFIASYKKQRPKSFNG